LLTSGNRTLYRSGSAYEVGPLEPESALELIAQETGRAPTGFSWVQAAVAYGMAEGQVQRLLQYAAFLTFSQSRSGQDPLSVVPPPEQARVLASGLSEPARRVLVALATFGEELCPEHFAAVTGLAEQPATGPGLAEAGAELLAAALVTRADVAILAEVGGVEAVGAPSADGLGSRHVAYRITPDAATAVTALDWSPASAETAALGLLSLLAADLPGPSPSPTLMLTIARMLRGAGQNQQASRFTRAAMPTALRAGQIQVWTRLASLGLQAASVAGPEAYADLAYFAQEDGIWRRLRGEKVVAAAALAGAFELTHQAELTHQSELARQAHLAGDHGAHGSHGANGTSGGHGANGVRAVRHTGSALRRSARYGAKSLSAQHGIALALWS
jgi:hypothetical protein